MRRNSSAKAGIFTLRGALALGLCATAAFCGTVSLRARPKSVNTVPDGNWSVVHSADISPQGLPGITCVSMSDCWAVGTSTNDHNVARTLVEHWNGSSWTIVASPNTNETESNRLLSVTCVAESDCWSVGYRTPNLNEQKPNTHHPLILHWDGLAWSMVASPDTLFLRFTDIACSASAD